MYQHNGVTNRTALKTVTVIFRVSSCTLAYKGKHFILDQDIGHSQVFQLKLLLGVYFNKIKLLNCMQRVTIMAFSLSFNCVEIDKVQILTKQLFLASR